VNKALQELGGQITLSDSELGGALFSVFIPKRRREK
jgi:sensor histidine kinase regulating citrate/malate metabolism